MSDEIDFVYQGPFYKAQKWSIHPKNTDLRHKPLNVLWTSPVDPKTGESAWMNWCRREGYEVDFYEQKRWHIVPHKNCKILTLLPDSSKFDKYTRRNRFNERILDFEAIAKDYDALYVPEKTVDRYNHSILVAWDVASCVFFKPKYTVMDDERYALYKAGKIELKEGEYTKKFEPQVNLHPRSLPPLSFKEVEDVSAEAAAQELRQMAKTTSKKRGLYKASLYIETAQKLEESQDFDSLDVKSLVNHPDILNVLLKHGMNPNRKIHFFGRERSLAEWADNDKSYKLLLQYGADPDVLLAKLLNSGESTRGVKLCLSAGANVNFSDRYGVTRLMEAWNPEHVELLLSFGANPMAVDEAGRSVQDYFEGHPLYHCSVLNCKMLEIAKQKLFIDEKMADLRSVLKGKSEYREEKTKTGSEEAVCEDVVIQKFNEQSKDCR